MIARDRIRLTRPLRRINHIVDWRLSIGGVGRTRDRLVLHNLSPEVHEGIKAFVEKRAVDYTPVRNQRA